MKKQISKEEVKANLNFLEDLYKDVRILQDKLKKKATPKK